MGFLDSLKSAYDSLEEAYYGFAEGLQSRGIPFMDYFVTPIESRGIPSFPIFLLFFVALAVGGLLVLTGLGGSGSRSLSISVMSEGSALDNVTVQVLFQDAIVASGVAKNGKIRFDNLPSSLLSVRFSKSGFKTVTLQSPVSQSNLKAELAATASGNENTPGGGGSIDYSQLLISVLDAETQRPVEGAQVLYVSDSSESGQKTSDAQGIVVLPKSPLLNLRVSKEGYQTETLAVRDGGQTNVYLKALGSTFFQDGGSDTGGGDTTDLSTQGAVSVILNTTSGPVDGHVRLYDSDGTLLGESDTAGGAATFAASIGKTVFITAQVPNRPLYDGSIRPQIVTQDTRFFIMLDDSSLAGGQDTLIRAQDSQGNALAFTAKIFKPPLLELGSFQGDRWQLPVAAGAYYVWIKADGYLAKTAELQIGKDNAFTLERATPFSSAALTISVQDEYGAVVSGARVTPFIQSRLAAPSQTTDSSGSVIFYEMALSSYEVTAELNGQNASVRVTVEQGGASTLVRLTIHKAALRVNAINALDGSALAGASVHLDSQGLAFADKITDSAGSASFADVPAQVQTRAAVTKDGFVPYVADVVLADGETRIVSAVLIPQSATSGIKVDLVQIRTTAGQRVVQLKTGGEYIVEINATPAASASNQSIYFRVGSKDTAESDDAAIIEFTTADSVLKSTSYQPSSDCQDLSANLVSSLDGYKWVELRFNQPALRLVSFLVSVKSSARSNQQLSLYFATNTQSGQLAARDPPDQQAVPCYPLTYEYKVPIVRGSTEPTGPTSTPTPSPTVRPLLPTSSTFTPSVGISYNPTTGKIDVDVSEIVLQVDSIHPRDSVPLKINDASCTIAYRMESQQLDCFKVSRTELTFEAREYNTACKDSFVRGNDVILKQDSAFLILSAICGGLTTQTKVPIKVNTQATTSIVTAPAQLDEGENTAKLLYVIDQKQAGMRTLTPVGASSTINVGTHSAAVFSWAGPGSLMLLDGEAKIGEWTYRNGQAYFEGIGTLGPRIETASDYLSCAQGWCTGPAALKALQLFKEEAQTAASKTVFRRRSQGISLGTSATATPSATPTATARPSPSASPTPSSSPAPSASASPSITPSPTATPTSTATPTASPAATSVTMRINDEKTAANGNKIKLASIEQASGSTFAFFDVLSPSGTTLDAPSLKANDPAYNRNGIQFQVTAISWSDNAAQRSAQVQLSGSWQLARSAPLYLQGFPASFENRFDSILSFADPSAPLSGEPFVFSTVMQLTEGADKVFDALSIQRIGAGCSGKPGVWLVQAKTTDGQNFQYSAQIMTLKQTLTGTNADLPLCGFLYAQKKQVLTNPAANLANIQQASEDHAKPKPSVAIFSTAPIMAQFCTATGTKITAAKAECMTLTKTIQGQCKAGELSCCEVYNCEEPDKSAQGAIFDCGPCTVIDFTVFGENVAKCAPVKAAAHATEKKITSLISTIKSAEQACNAKQLPVFEIPFSQFPQMSQLSCATPDKYPEKFKQITSKAPRPPADYAGDVKEFNDQFKAAVTSSIAAKGCVAICRPVPACVQLFPGAGNQLTQIIHLGLSGDCMPFSENAAMELASSFAMNSMFSSLSQSNPYAQMGFMTATAVSGSSGSSLFGGGCFGSLGFFNQQQPMGPGGAYGAPGGYSGGYSGTYGPSGFS